MPEPDWADMKAREIAGSYAPKMQARVAAALREARNEGLERAAVRMEQRPGMAEWAAAIRKLKGTPASTP